MDIYSAMEESYKRGYANGYADASGSARKGRWIVHNRGLNNWVECSECLTCGSPHWKVCPVCEARMEVSDGK